MPDNILIIKPSSLGDVVHGLPVLAKLRAAYPDARISWLVGTAAAPVIEAHPDINRIFYFRRSVDGLARTVKAHWSLVRELAAARFDCVVDLQGLFRSAFFGYMTGAPRRIGFANAREGAGIFYTERIDCDGRAHAVDRCLAVGKVLGFDSAEPRFTLVPEAHAASSVERILKGPAGPLPRPYVVLSPGTRWATKRWPAASFADAAKRLQERFGGTYFVTGTAAESGDDAKTILERVGESAVNLVGRTSLAETIALIARADLLVTPDSGPMHIADALGTPLVAVFGATDPARTGPYFQRGRVIRADGACPKAPCLSRDCPDVKCMNAVSGADVFSKMAAVLEGAA